MNLEERKYQIIEKVMQLNEEGIQKMELFLREDDSLLSSLDNALQQVKEGKITDHTEVRKLYEKWL